MAEQNPTFSIVIPTYARADALQACLEALCTLNTPRADFEVIVVDDGSPVDMNQAIAPFTDRLNLTLHRQANSGPARARNTGVSLARGRYVALTDDDCAPDKDWLKQLTQGLERSPDAMVGGHTCNGLSHNPYSAASQALMTYLYRYYNQGGHQGFLASNNMAMRTDAFLAVGGFDTRYPRAAGEDREFCDRWLAHDYAISYSPEAIVRHYHLLDSRGFWRQHHNYGRGAYQLKRAQANRRNDRLRFEALRFYLGLIRHPFGEYRTPYAALLSLLLLFAQVATVAGFLTEARLVSASAEPTDQGA